MSWVDRSAFSGRRSYRNFFANIASVGGCELGLSDAAVDLARAVERQGIDDLHEPRMCVGRTFVQTIGFETVGADAGALAQHHHCRWHQAFHTACGTGATTAFTTSGCANKRFSTSFGYTFSPPQLNMSSTRLRK